MTLKDNWTTHAQKPKVKTTTDGDDVAFSVTALWFCALSESNWLHLVCVSVCAPIQYEKNRAIPASLSYEYITHKETKNKNKSRPQGVNIQ